MAVTLATAGSAHAFGELNPAQSLIYGRAHLANLVEGDSLRYEYRADDRRTPDVLDSATLVIAASHADGKRDVELDFLSDERHLKLPTFESWRGNPVLIAMFERLAQDMSNDVGAGALYFRNRIRDALAGDATRIESVEERLGDRPVQATRLSFRPFVTDAYLGSRPDYADAEFSVIVAEGVPGGVLAVGVAPADFDGTKPYGELPGFHRELRLQP